MRWLIFLILFFLAPPIGLFSAAFLQLGSPPAVGEKPPAQTEPEEQESEGEEETSAEQQSPEAESIDSVEPVQEEESAAEESPNLSETPVRVPDSPSGGLGFRFNGVPINTVIDTVMQELGYSYVIDPRVQGTVSIHTMEEIPREKVFEVLEQLLQMNGQAIVRQDGLYVIIPLGQSTKVPHEFVVSPKQSSPESIEEGSQASPSSKSEMPPQSRGQSSQGATVESGLSTSLNQGQSLQEGVGETESVVSTVPPPEERERAGTGEGVITYIIPLHFIPSAEMVTMITPFVSNGANIINYASANILILTDYRRNIEQVLKLVTLLDTEYFDVNTVDLIPIRHNQAVDVAEDLGQIFAPGDPAGVRIVVIERLNSILVVTRSPSVFQKVSKWIDKLDASVAGTNIKTFVYEVENNTAMNIAEVLAQLYQDGLGLPSGGRVQAASAGQSQQPSQEFRQPGFVSPFQQQQGFGGGYGGVQLGPSLAGRPLSSQIGVQAVVTGTVKIIVNKFNNSLIIQATESDYDFLLQTIRQLDVLPRQVLIEAKIYSVELRNDLKFGVAAFLEERAQAASLGPATTGKVVDGAFAITTRTFVGAGRQLEAAITALSTKTNVEMVEAPRLLAMDGMQASINVGAEVPVTTASFGDPLRSGSSTAFVNSIQFRPTGTTLMILPRISASGIVTMDLAIEVSSATGASLTPTINRNFITTSLMVEDGQTVALAGIISDQMDSSQSRIPFLGDIPILGALFGQTARSTRRVELIFFITPHVIRNLPTATELTLDFSQALDRAYEFIERKEREEDEIIQERRK